MYLDNGTLGFILFVTFFGITAYAYVKSWAKLKDTYRQRSVPWPLIDHREIVEVQKRDFFKGYILMLRNLKESVKMVFSPKEKDPVIIKAALCVKLVLLTFVLVPIILILTILTGAILYV